MLKIIKLISLDSTEVLFSKLDNLKEVSNMNMDDEFSTAGLLEMSMKDTFEIEIDDNTSIVFASEVGNFSYFLDVLKKVKVNFLTEDMTYMYFTGRLDEVVPNDMGDRLNEVLIETLSVDNVLDKISESGIDSLNDVDKMVLQRA
jgi:hypothetical protein